MIMADAILSLKSDPRVLDSLRAAAQQTPTTAELFEQRVSFVYSAMSEKSGVSREQVRQFVSAHVSGVPVQR
jgi:hypothetical protein